MKKIKKFLRKNYVLILAMLAIAAVVVAALGYRLGTLIGLSPSEQTVAATPIGWTGILDNPIYLPLLILRSIAFWLTDSPGATITRLPNVLIGAAAVTAFTLVLRTWHGTRISLLGGLLFLGSAWTLHVARFASFDVLYLLLVPLLVLLQIWLQKYAKNRLVVSGTVIIWSILLFIPGGLWFLLLSLFFQRKTLKAVIKMHPRAVTRVLFAASAVVPLSLLAVGMVRGSTSLLAWLGAPAQFTGLAEIGRNLLNVPFHLLAVAPANPELWLGRQPILSVFGLVCCVLGIYFYVRNYKAARARMLLGYTLIGWLLVSLRGPVTLSVLVPLVFIFVAAGLAYLLRDWLKTFPNNPFARSIGIVLLIVAVIVTVIFNLQRYFVAWPNSPQTQAVFAASAVLDTIE